VTTEIQSFQRLSTKRAVSGSLHSNYITVTVPGSKRPVASKPGQWGVEYGYNYLGSNCSRPSAAGW
jgi:hypothetical protein